MALVEKRISEALKARGVKRLAYFHTDHFEPWRLVGDRDGGMARAVGDVEQFARAVEGVDFARRASLFLKSNVNFAADNERPLIRVAADDLLGFVPRAEEEMALGRAMLAPIVAGEFEPQIHIHHENFGYNLSLRDATTREYLQTEKARSYDAARLELAIKLNLQLLRDDAGIDLNRWFFIHGHWALNASDPNDCTIVREIEILMRNGCLGDFTQPSGRPVVDSRIDRPYLALPVADAKGYDAAKALPIPAEGESERAKDRFFLWASALTHASASIDCYSRFVRQRAAEPTRFGIAQAEKGVLVDGTLYVKTHAHTMAPAYWDADGKGIFPHVDPEIVAELTTLFESASAAGVELAFLTASEVYDEIIAAPRAEGVDLAKVAGLDHVHQMADVGTTIVHKDEHGTLVPPPPLPEYSKHIPAPVMWRKPFIGRMPIVPSIITLEDWTDALSQASWQPPPSLLASNAERINRIARKKVTALIEQADDRYGLTGYYITRARDGSLLQPVEIRLAAWLLEHFGPEHCYQEIGCGLGLLSFLLASLGAKAQGVERHLGRAAIARDLQAAVLADGLIANGQIDIIEGVFPKALPVIAGRCREIAVVTNLLGAADLAAQQRFINGLRRFDNVVIDMQRFFTRRADLNSQAELHALFQKAGFAERDFVFSAGTDGDYWHYSRANLPLISRRREDWKIRLDRWRSR